MKSNMYLGSILSILAAGLWGISGAFAQFLFEKRGVNAEWLITMRLLISGIILLTIASIRSRSTLFDIWKDKKDIFSLLMFSILGMMSVQYTYFSAIQYSNAATATVLQYMAPLFISGFYAFKAKRLPSVIERVSIVCALTGTFLLVTHGRIDSLMISPKALYWGIMSAVSLAFYSVYPGKLLSKYGPMPVIGWGMFIGGASLCFVHSPVVSDGVWDYTTVGSTAFVVLLGSLASFYAYLTAVKLIGATKASLLACAEPLAAVFLAVLWLNVSFELIDLVGVILILGTIVMLSLSKMKESKLEAQVVN